MKIGNCKQCGKEFHLYSTRLKFCSKTCAYQFNRGKNHPLFGVGHSEEAKRRISENKERAEKISSALKGRKKSAEHIRKIVESRKKNGTNVAWNEGMPRDEYLKHYKNPIITPSNLGRHHSELTKKKMSLKQKGRIFSEETKKKMSETRKAQFKLGNPKGHFFKKGRYTFGKYNPRWKDGKSFKSYPLYFNNRFKKEIKRRDGYNCLICNNHQVNNNFELIVHHINYDKLITIPRNCCSLCHSCHSMTQTNRPHWTKFFQGILKEKHGYDYNLDEKVIMQLHHAQVTALNLKSKLSSE